MLGCFSLFRVEFKTRRFHLRLGTREFFAALNVDYHLGIVQSIVVQGAGHYLANLVCINDAKSVNNILRENSFPQNQELKRLSGFR